MKTTSNILGKSWDDPNWEPKFKITLPSPRRSPSSRQITPSQKSLDLPRVENQLSAWTKHKKLSKKLKVTLGGDSTEIMTSPKERYLLSLGLTPNIRPNLLETNQIPDSLRRSLVWNRWYQGRLNARPWPLRQFNPGDKTCSIMGSNYKSSHPRPVDGKASTPKVDLQLRDDFNILLQVCKQCPQKAHARNVYV